MDLLKDKEILIVGNGKGILGRGEQIDSYEYVVRFNYGISQKCTSVGDKCSAWVYAMANESVCRQTYRRATIKPTVCVRFANPCYSRIGEEFICLAKERLQIYEELVAKFNLSKRQNPSTGISFLHYVLTRCSPKAVTIIGFDSFKTPNFYANKVHATIWHDAKKEREYIESLRGQITIL